MNEEEIKQKKHELNAKIAVLLDDFENDTGVQVSDVGFVRRVSYDELGREIDKVYVAEVEVKNLKNSTPIFV